MLLLKTHLPIVKYLTQEPGHLAYLLARASSKYVPIFTHFGGYFNSTHVVHYTLWVLFSQHGSPMPRIKEADPLDIRGNGLVTLNYVSLYKCLHGSSMSLTSSLTCSKFYQTI